MSIRPAAAARPLRFWRTEQLERLERLLEPALRSWARDWGVDESAVRPRGQRAAEDHEERGEGTTLRGPEGALAWLRDGAPPAALARELFGEEGSAGGIAQDLARACLDDATRRIACVLAMPGGSEERATPPPPRRGAWDGQVRITLPFDGVLLMNAAAVGACLGSGGNAPERQPAHGTGTPIPLLRAATAQRVTLRARLESCEVDLGLLQELRPGDVLRIPHRLDAPLQVCTATGTTLFSGYLASSRGRKALELATSA